MTDLRIRGTAAVMLLGLNIFLMTSCAVTDGGYAYSTDVRIGMDYYTPGLATTVAGARAIAWVHRARSCLDPISTEVAHHTEGVTSQHQVPI